MLLIDWDDIAYLPFTLESMIHIEIFDSHWNLQLLHVRLDTIQLLRYFELLGIKK